MPTAVYAVRLAAESAFAFALRVLTEYINEVRFLPGERLVEADIAARLGISRTPVHDAFVCLARQNLLSLGRRGAVVQPLRVDAIYQQVWMYRTVGLAVLGSIFNQRLPQSDLAVLDRCAAAEQAAVEARDANAAARTVTEFFDELYALAGHRPAHRAMVSVGTDYLRLLRLCGDLRVWQYIAERHRELALALAQRRHEDACAALEAQFSVADPLVRLLRGRWPSFFV